MIFFEAFASLFACFVVVENRNSYTIKVISIGTGRTEQTVQALCRT